MPEHTPAPAVRGSCRSIRGRSPVLPRRHETSADGRLTLEPVFRLGLCACGPAALPNGAVVARLAALLQEVR